MDGDAAAKEHYDEAKESCDLAGIACLQPPCPASDVRCLLLRCGAETNIVDLGIKRRPTERTLRKFRACLLRIRGAGENKRALYVGAP
ncbi:hypothetical protein AN218_04895 [Streptomyces nanshensis]|uniref:Uncharacterized protein n=1 Tax=Streptomyces nanshensis TaxID=518642 RepID=A0A1E7LAM7_9ACTN|nr:hypothetical protein AN218_04895 [Streptomyces nanshensis]